ncbi:TniB family NTP-binding protein [Thalassotalea ponticola]|uniref:TniB family NTP-binding protein n=1 Tax=Thalassotalea ponticola TaxID=1523392 RepID=UPI0025B39AFA|nr:TniB family NTP-binding protein [Thalassotalea ponticola]MDN3653599.1 TniB family NTP-binding protein [Thalassotalea ponticola]
MVIKNNSNYPFIKIPSSLVKHDSLEVAWQRICRVHAMHTQPKNKKGVLIYGESGEGKSFLAEQYEALFPPRKVREKTFRPVFRYRFKQSNKQIDDILKLLIKALGTTPPKGKTEPGELDEQFRHLVKELGVELIILDEIQQVLPNTDGVTALNTLKYFCSLLDELPASIVFIGSERAMRLLTFGKTDKTVDDNEQLSRRMMRSVKLEKIEPRTDDWLECINWFIDKIGFPFLNYKDGPLLNRLYLAYMERSFSTLESLFLLEDMSDIKDKSVLLSKLKENYSMYGKAKLNPFCSDDLPDSEVNTLVNRIFQTGH